MAPLYLMVGLPCSGKTTRAKELENEVFALRPTPGEWHVNLFSHDIHDPDHNKRQGLIEDILWQIAARALSLGTNIILDFGVWAKEERDDFRLRAGRLGARSQKEELLRLFIEHAPSALAMFDRNMGYLYLCRRWRCIYDLGERDMQGLSHDEIFPETGVAWREVSLPRRDAGRVGPPAGG